MNLNELLKQKNMTKYKLSKNSQVPFATISDISTGKTNIKNCSVETLYKLAQALDVSMEALVVDSMEHRSSFDIFKSNVCHRVHDMGDMDFIIDTLETDRIRKLYQKQWYPESLYTLAMVDYLSRENDLPLCNEYNDLRFAKLRKPIYPSSVVVMSIVADNDQPKKDSYTNAIPEFKRFNIIENEVRNVY